MKKTFKTFVFAIVGLLALASCEDVPAPFNMPDKNSNSGGSAGSTIMPEGDGTAASPYNVAAIVAKIKEMEAGVESTEEFYIKGKVINVTTTEAAIAQYGNHTFEMVDEGDNSTVFTAFQVYGPGKQKFTSVNDIKVGDEVVVCGRVVNYKGNTPETVGKGAAYVVSINSSGSGGGSDTNVDPQGDGTEASPYNIAAIVAKVKSMAADVESDQEYYIKGKVQSVSTNAATITQYGNHTFTMVDEGNSSTIFTAFQVYGPGKQKFTSVDDIKVGDEVVVCGKVVNYKGNTPETVGKGAAYVVSINSSGGGGGTNTSTSSKDNPLSVNQAKTASGNNYVKGYIVGYVDGQKLAEGATFGVPANEETEILLAETPNETDPSNVFPVQLPQGDIRNALELSAHPDYLKKEVLLYGSVDTYFGVPGLKATSWGSINGNTFGKDPESGSTDVPSGEAKGSGTESDPYNAIAAILYAQSLGSDVESTNDIYVTGIISSIKYTYSSSYGTATYNISVDGKAENEFTVYGSYYLNNQPWADGDTQIQLGNVVVVCGKVINYKGNTPEFVNKKNWLVSITSGGTGDGGGQGGDDGGQGGGDPVTDLVNGDFESWVSDSEPTGWQSASSASNAVLSKSTEAHGGNFACKVGAPGTQNKRLATQEMTLEPGSYTFSYYAKSTTAQLCQSRGGYVPVTNGNVGSYKYGSYVNIKNSEWTLVSYEFVLTETTTLCLFASNPKESAGKTVSQDILVDDATLVKK